MRLHLAARRFHQWRLRPLAKLFDGAIRVLCAARVPAEAEIHPTAHFSHNGLAVLITTGARIGPGCQIGTHAVIGSNWPKEGAPTLESSVIVGPGAMILGPVTLGEGAVIAANTVVLQDVPPRALVAGNPAEIKKTNIDTSHYRYPIVSAAAE
ncbi:MAG: serine O-acetyltransferase [Aestuariivirga sp.]